MYNCCNDVHLYSFCNAVQLYSCYNAVQMYGCCNTVHLYATQGCCMSILCLEAFTATKLDKVSGQRALSDELLPEKS
jgi:hypothetical protein